MDAVDCVGALLADATDAADAHLLISFFKREKKEAQDMRYLSHKVVLVVAAVAMAAMRAAAQAPAQKPSFEVASVKPSAPGSRIARFSSVGGRFSVTMMTLRALLQFAYQPQNGAPFMNSRIIGGPGWTDTDRFDIEAKTEEASAGPIPKDKLQPSSSPSWKIGFS